MVCELKLYDDELITLFIPPSPPPPSPPPPLLPPVPPHVRCRWFCQVKAARMPPARTDDVYTDSSLRGKKRHLHRVHSRRGCKSAQKFRPPIRSALAAASSCLALQILAVIGPARAACMTDDAACQSVESLSCCRVMNPLSCSALCSPAVITQQTQRALSYCMAEATCLYIRHGSTIPTHMRDSVCTDTDVVPALISTTRNDFP